MHRRGRRRWRSEVGGRERGRSNEVSKAKPEMFDAWIERGGGGGGWTTVQSDDILKWEVVDSVVS